MIRFSLKAPRLTAVFLCLALGAPAHTWACADAARQPEALDNTAATVTPARPGGTTEARLLPEAQLLDDEEIAALSQRNQNPGPAVRGGALSNEHLTYIVIALAAIVLVLVLK